MHFKEEESSGDEMRKRRKDEEGGIFQCDQCDKSFNKQSSLARHKYEHSGWFPNSLIECNIIFFPLINFVLFYKMVFISFFQ